MTNTYSKEYFDDIINDKYIITENGYYIFNGDRWNMECFGFSPNKPLNSDECCTQILSYLHEYDRERKTFNCVQDYSRTQINGMCFNLQLIKDDYDLSISHSLCINLSVIIPFFHIHVLELKRREDDFSKWDGFPKRIRQLEASTHKSDIENIKSFLISKLCLNEFPDDLMDIIVPKVFTEDIRKGEFTYFNAFFQREYDTR